MTKSELRQIYLDKRSALTPGDRDEASRRIADRFFETCDLSAVKTLHCFVPIEKFNEIDTSLIYKRVWNDHLEIQVTAPRLDRVIGQILSVVFAPETELIGNTWGISEPAGTESVEASEIDIVIVPLLCFDEVGHRVGYGKGYYDKFLSRCREDCLKVGLSYFPPVPRIDDVNEYDVPLDYCLSPNQTHRFQI